MSKEEVFQFLMEHAKPYCKEDFFKKKFPDFYSDLMDWSFPSDFSFQQKIYHYFKDDLELKLGHCPVCGRRCVFLKFTKGYSIHCCHDCVMKDKDVKHKIKQTCKSKYGVDSYAQTKECKEKMKNRCLERYGVENYAQTKECRDKIKSTSLKKYGVENYAQTKECQDKMKNTCLNRYGVENVFSSEDKKLKIKDTCVNKYGVENYSSTLECRIKVKNTCLERYGTETYSQTDECKKKVKETNLEKFGVENYTQTDEYKIREYNTKKKNHSFNTSKVEQDFKKYLEDNNIDFKYQYKSVGYPFNCDFYLPKYDLYIEIQGSWTHGGHPFDKENEDDIKKLNMWKSRGGDYYNKAIEVWTKRDPLKRKTVKENNLNWIEVFSKSINDVIESFINTISKI